MRNEFKDVVRGINDVDALKSVISKIVDAIPESDALPIVLSGKLMEEARDQKFHSELVAGFNEFGARLRNNGLMSSQKGRPEAREAHYDSSIRKTIFDDGRDSSKPHVRYFKGTSLK